MPHRLALAEMRALLASRRLSSLELVQAHLHHIRQTNPAINAFTELYEEQSLSHARDPRPGPLSGIPVTVKDSFDYRGRPTFCGSLLRQNEIAARHSTVVDRLENAGAIVLGRTACPEFLYYYETDNRITGRVNHPLNPNLTPGGSSGGEAAAIAACMSAAGVGSDGGGSVRVPAHLCGLCGLKPTPGRVPAGGHWPEITHPAGFMGVAGPLARTAHDLEIVFQTLQGYDVRDPFSTPAPSLPQPSELCPIVLVDHYPVEPACRAALLRAAHLLEDIGHPILPCPPAPLDEAHHLWRALFIDLITQSLRAYIHGREDQCAWTGLELMRYAEAPIDTPRLAAVLARRDRLRAEFLEALPPNAVLLAPAFGATAWPHRQPPMDILEAARPATPANLLGLPALVLPILVGDNGVPAGVQLIGSPFSEVQLLHLAQRIETVRGPAWQTTASSPTPTTSTTSPTA